MKRTRYLAEEALIPKATAKWVLPSQPVMLSLYLWDFWIDLIYHKLKEGPNFLKVILDKTEGISFLKSSLRSDNEYDGSSSSEQPEGQ
jgi:hypothetical protein